VDPNLLSNLVRFGVFELDLRARELRKGGLSTGLPEQSIKILALLLEKPGELVLREEIRKKLWPNDTVVEFDHSINAAIKRLRQALDDPADAPQYIETLARRGYRWKIPVEPVEAQPQTARRAEGEGVQSGPAAGGNLIGKKVSHYRVLEVLGGGGMGVVFKAEDLKLGRRVALKFLPQETANDPLTLRRFEQEARAASALNHPNICTIYGIEEHEGQPFIVMEFLEGETLRELITAAKTRTPPLPLENLLDLAMQITQGLEAAHQNGIIHRDIKPANIFVTTQGQAKILDFGLAKLVPMQVAADAYPGRDHRTDEVHGTPEETMPRVGSDLLLSRTGVAMGTAGYMSPEQVRGEKLDSRTDLFSFGLVLYEMATGKRAFTGDTGIVVQEAILHQTPSPVRGVNPELPAKLGEIISKALEKDREARYRTASEMRADLQALGDLAEDPKYIETVARRGYRLIVPVEWPGAALRDGQGTVVASPEQSDAGDGALIGKKVSHYRVLQLLGGGGMGVVYGAEDLKLGRRVALKFLPEELANDAAAMQRFEREARAASALNHPNICTIYSVEEHEGQPFIVMELLEGRTLREIILQEADSKTETVFRLKPLLDTALQIAHGLEAAHEKGIIHRDIKPANIFITTHGQAKILDFGLAKLHEFESVETPPQALAEPAPKQEWNPLVTLTRTGVTVGTAAYMSPEQVRGEKLDPRTDLFSFGLVLYEMATRLRAFPGDTAPVLHDAILNQAPVPVRELNGQIPAKLENVVGRALEKDREARYQTAAEMCADFETLKREREQGSPILRWMLAVGMIVVAVGAVLVGLNVRLLHRRSSGSASIHRIQSLAVLPLENLSGDPSQDYFADGMTDALTTDLSKISALRVISRTSAMLYKGTNKTLPEIAKELNVDGIVEGSVMRSGNRVRISAQLIRATTDQHVWADSYEHDLGDVLKLQGEVAQAIAQQVRVQLTPQQQARLGSARAVNPEAYEAYLKGRFYATTGSSTLRETKNAQRYFEEAIQKDSGFALAYVGLAECDEKLGVFRWIAPQDAYRPAKAALYKALRLDETVAEAHAVLGWLGWRYDWDWPTAEREFNLALELNPNYGDGHAHLAVYLGWAGRRAEALAEVAKVRELNPDWTFNVESQIYYLQRDYKAMVEAGRQSVASNPGRWPRHYFLAVGYEGSGQRQEAIPEYQKAVELSQGDTDPTAGLAHAYAVSGQRASAEKILRELLQKSKTSYVSPYMIGTIYAGLGDKNKAFEFLEKAYQERSPDIPYFLKADLRIDNLRSDPRFQDLLRRVGLPQ
jgi:serine/threonine protein kinase/TolB-like protein